MDFRSTTFIPCADKFLNENAEIQLSLRIVLPTYAAAKSITWTILLYTYNND